MSKRTNGFILLAMALGLLMASLDNTITSGPPSATSLRTSVDLIK